MKVNDFIIKFLIIGFVSFNVLWCGAAILLAVMAGGLHFRPLVFISIVFGLSLLTGLWPIALMRRGKKKFSLVLALIGMLTFFGYIQIVGGDESPDNVAHMQKPKP